MNKVEDQKFLFRNFTNKIRNFMNKVEDQNTSF
jgi:hypothetical protein